MEFYKQKKIAHIGSYKPSENWSAFTHFAVMDQDNQGMLASCGFFQALHKEEVWDFEMYLEAAASIQQAQLYAHAPQLLEALQQAVVMIDPVNKSDCDWRDSFRKLIADAQDITEPATRLLGENAMQIINEAKKRSNA